MRIAFCLLLLTAGVRAADTPVVVSGIYPHLAMFNNEGECGTGAVVPWARRLWVITYAPHQPKGSSDKLYEITPDLKQVIRPESIGGTNANRMIHKESNQLFIGPYAIDADRNVRTIPFTTMFGRHTGTARHLTDPANKVYTMTMEEGLYEIDVKTLAVKTLYDDEQVKDGKPKANLPGYHGKGLYSGQGRLVYANNGEHGAEALKNPFTPSGVLASWDGNEWQTILRSQFTEVTGPGGISGNDRPDSDPIWSIGWDAKSLILMCLDSGKWHRFRLPKSSHSYDGAHGWNTEWPRIRDIGEKDLLMTMHGAFWRFPKTFSAGNTAGIAPRSNYLKVIGDFARWEDRIVFGCDDTARNEFLNKRKAKGTITAPQSQSNLWFVKPDDIDGVGPAIGRGAVWWNDAVKANEPSDPYLFHPFGDRGVHFVCPGGATVTFEVDRRGDGQWVRLEDVVVPESGYVWHDFRGREKAQWIRLKADRNLSKATAFFHYCDDSDPNLFDNTHIFDGLAKPADNGSTGGLVRARDQNKRTLYFSAIGDGRADLGLYELDADLKLRKVDNAQDLDWHKSHTAIPPKKGVLEVDDASVVYIDDAGKRFRLPKGDPAFDKDGPLGPTRLCREVATERDLFNCHGTFYELPAENAGGFQRVRPVCTHNRQISDYCSYRGLFVVSGVNLEAAGKNQHIIKSDDGKAGLWCGAIDDIWRMGKPRGVGGPWKNTAVKAGQPSDPYLMTGYDNKTLEVSSSAATTLTMELDISGTGDWHAWRAIKLAAGESYKEVLPEALQAYWVRFRAADDTKATAQLTYK